MHEQDNLARPARARHPEPVRAYAAMNTVRALECLAFAALSTSELAESVGVSVRTARRLVQRLVLEGFVVREAGRRGRYRATLRLAALGRQMLDHAPLAQAAASPVAQLARDTGGVAHLWIAGYEEQVVCVAHARGRVGATAEDELLWHVASAPSSAAGMVLLADRAQLRSCCYLRGTSEPMFAAAVLERGHVVGALGVTGETALEASGTVVAAAARLSADLGSVIEQDPADVRYGVRVSRSEHRDGG